uniref:Uncharacterized protein n=1 Tax=Kalanchoe fedtschenkoi TaxID=63787 RepID=A0A7N0RC28_KALFE
MLMRQRCDSAELHKRAVIPAPGREQPQISLQDSARLLNELAKALHQPVIDFKKDDYNECEKQKIYLACQGQFDIPNSKELSTVEEEMRSYKNSWKI